MRIYIKGMKMPKQCYDCYLIASDPDDENKLYCKHLNEDIMDWCSRLENCPLVEVKEPHGRLVDLDALEKERDSIDCCGNSLVALEWDDECIMNAPTIIEAEDDTHDQCMECGAIFCITSSDEWEVNYCPNCGARIKKTVAEKMIEALEKDQKRETRPKMEQEILPKHCIVPPSEAVPSAEPNEDCISRKAAIDVLDTGLWGVEWGKALAIAMLKDLPSAEPKRGKWIEITDAREYGKPYIVGFYCSECDTTSIIERDFCPYCKARMESVGNVGRQRNKAIKAEMP